MTQDETPLRRVWVTRAEPGASATAARIAALGFTPIVHPLLAVRPIRQDAPDLTGVAALAFTSANGVRAFVALIGGQGEPASRSGSETVFSRCVFAVGDATAQVARDAGFADVRSAQGDVAALARLIRDHAPVGKMLLAGARERAGDLADLVGSGADMHVLEVYETVETEVRAPEGVDVVMLHSPRAARALAAMKTPPARDLVVVALSQAVASALSPVSPIQIRIAAAPTDDALIAALGKPPPRV